MALVRNVSGQSIVINRTGGGALQLLPQRAVDLSEAERRSGQIQNLLQTGLLLLETTVSSSSAVSKPAGKKSSKPSKAKDKGKNK